MTSDLSDSTAESDVLAPLRQRYTHWLALDEAGVRTDREEAAEDIRALQLVLRMERAHPPGWHDAVALAASATARLCTDPRATALDGPWHDAVHAYAEGHIRKVTRRARASQWQAVQDLPGVTLGMPARTSDAEAATPTEVRALLPGRVTELDKRVAKLQVGGTDAPIDDPGKEPRDRPLLRFWLPPEPVMTLGKSMAQAGHASMIAAALLAGDMTTRPVLTDWVAHGCPAVGWRAEQTRWSALVGAVNDPHRAWQQDRLLAVRDAGFTEIVPGTVTVIAQLV